jgi:hypothetical protein
MTMPSFPESDRTTSSVPETDRLAALDRLRAAARDLQSETPMEEALAGVAPLVVHALTAPTGGPLAELQHVLAYVATALERDAELTERNHCLLRGRVDAFRRVCAVESDRAATDEAVNLVRRSAAATLVVWELRKGSVQRSALHGRFEDRSQSAMTNLLAWMERGQILRRQRRTRETVVHPGPKYARIYSALDSLGCFDALEQAERARQAASAVAGHRADSAGYDVPITEPVPLSGQAETDEIAA